MIKLLQTSSGVSIESMRNALSNLLGKPAALMPNNGQESYPVPVYATDEQTAIKYVGGNVEIVSEGEWKLFCNKPG